MGSALWNVSEKMGTKFRFFFEVQKSKKSKSPKQVPNFVFFHKYEKKTKLRVNLFV